jgi:hypothetical protein
MSNSHDEIKRLVEASRKMLSNTTLNEDINSIRKKHGIINEQDNLISNNVTQKVNVTKNVEDKIEDSTDDTPDDKSQGYRVVGGIIVLHGKDNSDLELTTDEKIAFQETMNEFVEEVSDLVDFNKLNLYPNNVEWSGKIIDFDLDFFFTIGEENGVYVNGEMLKADDEFLEMINKLKVYYEKFKSKWAKVLASRKQTNNTEEY